jgi:hypothetical protein
VAELDSHIDVHRQAYNYTLYEYDNDNDNDNVDAADIGSTYNHHHSRLSDWKDGYPVPVPVFSEAGVHSKALNRTITRFYQNLTGL